MLSYRHAFHAGNPADCLKHAALVFCLAYLARKETPFFCADTHAGAGLYALDEGFAALNREWEQGIGRLYAAEKQNAPGQILPAMLRRYLELVTGSAAPLLTAPVLPSASTKPAPYPGSPEIIRRMLRSRDTAVCFELHPGDFAALDTLLRRDRRITVRQEDGFGGLLGFLPPPCRRGLILIDPPYEVKDDYHLLPETLSRAFKRFSTGTYIVWYPLMRSSPAPELPLELTALCTSCGPRGSYCRVELYTAPPDAPPLNSPRGMYGSGLVIRNPPWTLKAALEAALPYLAEIFSGDWLLQWEEA
ncbi:MAG: 23S rRNA (adenine(2030)-N(6))-methyltransferase RlmJ [Treponema sp.]|jgi:23S rRNA (adenine2030-N6)-methyltransferase|nr:23S rRNA (adenine(2030)-N(6))-methyltransferase RlmJ [Treponema sp.]